MRLTPNYKFQQYEPDDVTSWLTTYNQFVGAVDSTIFGVDERVVKNTTDIIGLEQQVATDHDEINEITGELSDLNTTVSGHSAQISGINNTVAGQNNKIAEIESNVEDISNRVGTVYNGVLTANETTIAVQIGEFNDLTSVQIGTSVWGVTPNSVELRAASGGQPNLCVMTFDAQSSDVKVAVKIG